MQLHISIDRKCATYLGTQAIVCGNSDYTAVFSFDDEWDDYPIKTARFITEQGYMDVQFSGNTCQVPVVLNVTWMKVGVFAGELRTTTSAFIRCKKSVLCDSEDENNQKIVINSVSAIVTGDGLKLGADGKISVDTADTVERGNNKPVTSDAVFKSLSKLDIDSKAISEEIKKHIATDEEVAKMLNDVFGEEP